ncbi:hypothetical protein B0O99DRAFT_636884 [Bisporella sp. PMI_857]|nr:hypothetical protein B0O99DRAFT_636884 [Bisporella sp. PMI_857]
MSLLEVQRMLSQRIASEQADGPFQISPNSGKKSPRIPYFEYSSHYNVKEFQAKCPGAKPIAIAWLRDWMWHLNTSGTSSFPSQQ